MASVAAIGSSPGRAPLDDCRRARRATAALAFLYFGLRILIEPGSQYVGVLDDPQIFDLVVRVVAARARARLESARDARALGAERA